MLRLVGIPLHLAGLVLATARAGSPPLGAPTLEELKNATYAGLQDLAGPVTLWEGRWEGEPYAPGGASRPSVMLAPGFRLTGDLDGDGAEETVVVLAQSSGWSGTFNSLAVVKGAPAGLRNVATTALGDRVSLRAARIEGGKLFVSVVRAGEKDARCCPGELADLSFSLVGRKPPRCRAVVTGRLSLDTLAGTDWVLRAWDLEEPAGGAGGDARLLGRPPRGDERLQPLHRRREVRRVTGRPGHGPRRRHEDGLPGPAVRRRGPLPEAARRRGSAAKAAGSTLIATARLSFVSVAR